MGLKSLQRFEAYDSNGAVVAGDKNKEVGYTVIHCLLQHFLLQDKNTNIHCAVSQLKFLQAVANCFE